MESSHKNAENHRRGKEPLKNAVLQHPVGNKEYDYLKGQVNRNFWVIPFNDWAKKQKLKK
jgi:hypothetical protein